MVLAAQTCPFLPDIAFFKKMTRADLVILLDNVHYSKKSMVNRAAIKTVTGMHWLTVPIFTTGFGDQSLTRVVIDNRVDWRRKHLRTLEVNYVNAPYFYRYFDFFEKTYQQSWERLPKLVLHMFGYLLEQLDFSQKRIIFSSSLPRVDNRTERVIKWLELVRCQSYVIREDEANLINIKDIRKSGFEVIVQPNIFPGYHQQFGDFVENTSVIDLLFNEGELAKEILIRAAREEK